MTTEVRGKNPSQRRAKRLVREGTRDVFLSFYYPRGLVDRRGVGRAEGGERGAEGVRPLRQSRAQTPQAT